MKPDCDKHFEAEELVWQGMLRKLWKWIVGILTSALVLSTQYKHIIDWVLKGLELLKGKKSKSTASPSLVSATVGDITNNGSGTVINNINIMSPPEKMEASDANHAMRDVKTSNAFKAFRKPIFGKSLEDRMIQELRTVESLHCVCDKDKIRVCIVDDKDSGLIKKGLELLGYNNVRAYKKCPSFDVLRSCAIAIFDIKGVGNQAGSDGLSLAEEFKRAYPTRLVIVRSGIITPERKREIEDRKSVDNVLIKDGNIGQQVGPILQASNIGDPVALWRLIRMSLLKKKNIAEVAVIEHKYVSAISYIAGDGRFLPEDWMIRVNKLLGNDIF